MIIYKRHSRNNVWRGLIHILPVRWYPLLMCIGITASLVLWNVPEHVRSRIKQRMATPSDYLHTEYTINNKVTYGTTAKYTAKAAENIQAKLIPTEKFEYDLGDSDGENEEEDDVLDENDNDENMIPRMAEIEAIHAKRYDDMISACKGREREYRGQHSSKEVHRNILVDVNNGFNYCAVEKVGSTFWRRLFMIVAGLSKEDSPYDLEPFDAFSKQITTLREFKWPDKWLMKSKKIMFSREPFSRLLSGYVDKLFGPTVMYWEYVGIPAVKIVRGYDTTCGHNVTFREFVKYFIYSQTYNVNRNSHFTPIYEHCHPCKIKYDIIGKLETFKNDTLYMLKRLGLDRYTYLMNEMNELEKVSDTLNHNTYLIYMGPKIRIQIAKCMSFYEAQQRTWKKMQIAGIISKYSKFPFSSRQSLQISNEQFREALLSAIGDAGDKKVSKRMRDEAFTEAYASVDENDIEKLRTIFEPDCRIFGYDCDMNLKLVPQRDSSFSYFDYKNA